MIIANTTWNIQNFRLNIIRMLLDNGFDVSVVTPNDEFMSFFSDYPTLKHIPLKHLSRKSLNPITDLNLLSELIKIYKAEKPDISLHYTIKPNIYGSFAAKRTNNNCISVVTGLGYTFIHNGILGFISKWLHKIALKSNRKVIFENNDDRLLFINQKILSKDKAISVKGCGINTEYFKPRNESIENKDVFLFIGRLLYDKGIREFVKAAEIVKKQKPNVKFWIAGDIDEDNPAAIKKSDLDTWINNGTVDYMGFVNDVRNLIHQSSCIVLPSYREAIARALQEGMAMGKPVIATDVAGCREAVDDGVNGFLVPVKESNSLAQSMIKFLALDEEAKNEMGRNGREKVLEQFDERIIAKNYKEIILPLTN